MLRALQLGCIMGHIIHLLSVSILNCGSECGCPIKWTTTMRLVPAVLYTSCLFTVSLNGHGAYCDHGSARGEAACNRILIELRELLLRDLHDVHEVTELKLRP